MKIDLWIKLAVTGVSTCLVAALIGMTSGVLRWGPGEPIADCLFIFGVALFVAVGLRFFIRMWLS